MPLPAAKPPDGATLFKQQCATCHTTNLSDPVRQGPSLFKIVGRPAGQDEGNAQVRPVTTGYLETLRIPLLAGRRVDSSGRQFRPS